MAEAGIAAENPLKVFISYSRKDEDFAEELLTGLALLGFQPYLDKHDIVAGEDWEARLGRLIEAADTVVFVISPDAVASERCAWEVERTIVLKKRLLPIVWRRVDEAQVPSRLRQLNYIFFDRPLMSVPSLAMLATALKTDIDWVREQTRLGEAALRWDARGRAEALLLRGEELASARGWLAAQPQYASEPTLLHLEFISSSEDAEEARTAVEQQRLDQMRAALEREKSAVERAKAAVQRTQRALASTAALFACIVVGGVGWYYEGPLKEQYHWRVAMGPLVLATHEEVQLAAVPGAAFKECARGCPTMIVVPAGKFMMGSVEGGSNDEMPQHEVAIAKPFAVGKFEISFAEWDECTTAGSCPTVSDNGWGRMNRPVVLVSWEDAKRYVAWLAGLTGKDYRLLSEAEWEYAARAGSTTAYWWGPEIGTGNANCYSCGTQWDGKQTSPVGIFKPNAFGLYDMLGNVWEWVEDDWHSSYRDAPIDGSVWRGGEDTSQVIRGGAWGNNPAELRSAYRGWNRPGSRRINIGFRVARSLSPPTSASR
jgi:formylglycine-generating enzyme required for sulfatase activity